MAEIKTRILLRNDEAANWESSTLSLRKGEAAVSFQNGKPTVHIASADNQTFADAPSLAAEAQVYQVEMAADETDVEAAIAAVVGDNSLSSGDAAIVKTPIAADKYSYTCYIYNGSAWAAADGNYRADNVYFDNDLTYTANIGVYSVPSSGSGTIPAEGKNVKEVLSAILAKEDYPKVKTPVSISVSGTNSEVEIGTTVNLSYSISTNTGAYTYGPATGITFSDFTAACAGQTADTQSGSFTVTAEASAKTVSATAKHTAGAVPVTNLGNPYPSVQISAGSVSASGCRVLGYRNMFYGPCTTDIELNSANIRKLTKQKSAATTLSNKAAGSGCVKYVVAVPSGRSLSKVLLTSSMNADITADFVNKGTVAVEGAESYEAANYTVYVYQPAKIDASEVYAITII